MERLWVRLENFKSVISSKTKVVAINHVSNVMGYIAPIKEIVEIARDYIQSIGGFEKFAEWGLF